MHICDMIILSYWVVIICGPNSLPAPVCLVPSTAVQFCKVCAQCVSPERKLTHRDADVSLGGTVTVTTRLLVVARQFDTRLRD